MVRLIYPHLEGVTLKRDDNSLVPTAQRVAAVVIKEFLTVTKES